MRKYKGQRPRWRGGEMPVEEKSRDLSPVNEAPESGKQDSLVFGPWIHDHSYLNKSLHVCVCACEHAWSFQTLRRVSSLGELGEVGLGSWKTPKWKFLTPVSVLAQMCMGRLRALGLSWMQRARDWFWIGGIERLTRLGEMVSPWIKFQVGSQFVSFFCYLQCNAGSEIVFPLIP